MNKKGNVLHMNKGIGNESYANNSVLQQNVILMAKPIIEEAIIGLCSSICEPKSSLNIVDLGCSSGPNTLLMMSILIKTIDKIYKRLHQELPEIQIYLNDLHGNDFNVLFKSLPNFRENLKQDLGYNGSPVWLFNGVPGTFYKRLFPASSIHFFHSSYSLHWLSQVPEALENNKENICAMKTSPPSVLKAYYDQFEKDFSIFLKFRSVELVIGGHMVLTILGRKSEDFSKNDTCYIFELLGRVLNNMSSQGSIQKTDVDSFNTPIYTPSARELKTLINKEGSFSINHLEVNNLHWTGFDTHSTGVLDLEDAGYNVAKCIRAVYEPLLISHFGEAIIDELFCKFRDIISDSMSKEKTEFTNITVSMTKNN